MDDVNQFLRKDPIEQVKDTPGYNSWVASLPREQYHLDIAYITKADKPSEGAKTEEDEMPPDEEAEEENFPEPVPAPKSTAKAKSKSES